MQKQDKDRIDQMIVETNMQYEEIHKRIFLYEDGSPATNRLLDLIQKQHVLILELRKATKHTDA